MFFKTLAATVVLSAVAMPAFAGDFSFRLQGFELSNEAARTNVLARLEKSIKRSCEMGRSATMAAHEEACVADLMNQIVAKIDNADLSKEFAARQGTVSVSGS